MDSQKPSDASHEWRLPNVITSVASYKFCVKSSYRDGIAGQQQFHTRSWGNE